MKLSDFDYPLPEDLIAQVPLAERDASRMLVLERDSGKITHSHFRDLLSFLSPGDLLVFNESRVVKARLEGKRKGGGAGALECFVLSDKGGDIHECLIRSSARKDGLEFTFGGGASGKVVGPGAGVGVFLVKFEYPGSGGMAELQRAHGRMPLPPYIDRADDETDLERYQTIYARAEGSVAAPTAGLHFTSAILAELAGAGIQTSYVSLHVGLGTFQPIKTENIDEHSMHRETFRIEAATLALIAKTKAEGRRVVAVGTTSARTLESWARGMGKLGADGAFSGSTDLFLRPGSEFRIVDAMLTNFHLPKSTLIVLLAAFAGLESVKAAYCEAVARRYRFFSYGDCMLVL